MEEKEEQKQEQKLMMDGEVVKLKSPGMKVFADFLIVSRDMAKAGDKATDQEMMACLTRESAECLSNMINLTVKKTFPNIEQYKLDAWTLENSMLLMPEVMSKCTPPQSHEQKKKSDMIRKLQHDQSTKQV